MKSSRKRIIPTVLGLTFGEISINFPTFNDDFQTIEGIIQFAKDLLNTAILFSAVVAVGLIIYSGILYMTATGEADKVERARKALTAAVIGMVIVFIARMLIVFLLTTFLT